MPGVVNLGWRDAPHLHGRWEGKVWVPSEAEILRLEATIPPYQKKARTLGIPMLGSGAIFPIEEDELSVKAFEIPDAWPRGYGLDVGWNWTAAVWMARDLWTDTVYVTDVYKRAQAEPAVHISAIKARGDWIPGYIDPSAAGAGKMKDGEAVLEIYQKYLMIEPADNTVEAGLFAEYERMTTGRFKVFSHLELWWEEFRLYRRDDKGKVVKINDHAMDATRYCNRGIDSWVTQPASQRSRYKGSLGTR